MDPLCLLHPCTEEPAHVPSAEGGGGWLRNLGFGVSTSLDTGELGFPHSPNEALPLLGNRASALCSGAHPEKALAGSGVSKWGGSWPCWRPLSLDLGASSPAVQEGDMLCNMRWEMLGK